GRRTALGGVGHCRLGGPRQVPVDLCQRLGQPRGHFSLRRRADRTHRLGQRFMEFFNALNGRLHAGSKVSALAALPPPFVPHGGERLDHVDQTELRRRLLGRRRLSSRRRTAILIVLFVHGSWLGVLAGGNSSATRLPRLNRTSTPRRGGYAR